MPSVLFVCTANVCRSPMAEALFKKRVADQPDAATWLVASAGTWALEGEPAVPEVQQILKERGIDVSKHRARTISRELIEPYNLVLTMEESHLHALRAEFSPYSKRIYLLSEMIGGLFEIRDPMGKSLKEFKHTETLIDRVLQDGMGQIRIFASRNPTIVVPGR